MSNSKSIDDIKKVEEVIPEHPSKFPMANVWISSAYQWGNIEKQLFDIAISKPERRMDPVSGNIKSIARVSVYEINALKTNEGQINYFRASKAAESLGRAFIRYEDKEKRKYSHINMLERCTYDNGQFTLVFTDSVVKMGYVYPAIDHPVSGFTSVLQGVNLLSDDLAIKLYQLLRMRCFGKTDVDGNYVYEVEVDELKFLMGLIDPEDKAFQESDKKYGLDSDAISIIDDLKTQKTEKGISKVPYQKYYDFRRYVLDRCIREINKEMDITVSYNRVRTSGKGVKKLRFLIKFNEKSKPSNEEVQRRIKAVAKFITLRDISWTTDNIQELLAAAGYNVDIVHDKYNLLLKQNDEKIRNRFGWLLAAIQNNYQDEEISGTGDIVDETNKEITLSTFERMWQLYSKKTRKDLITKKVIRDVNSRGFETMKQALDNYESVIEQNRNNGFSRARMSGGAFFSGAYRDYLPDIWDKKTDEEKGYIREKKSKNKFLNTEKTSTDYAALAEQEEMDKVINGFD